MIAARKSSSCATGHTSSGLANADLPALRVLGDLKRIRSAGQEGSIAERLFRDAWCALVAGDPTMDVLVRTTSRALVSSRLGDIDGDLLGSCGLDHSVASSLIETTFYDASRELGLRLDQAPARSQYTVELPGDAPNFVVRLAAQPRAGVTCPGRTRLMLLPAENHAEHSLLVAVYAVIAAGRLGVDPAPAFLAGLAHHLHNAVLPDIGYSGEILLGRHLDTIVHTAREKALSELPSALRAEVADLLGMIASAETPAARAFHAADVLDRVLQIEWHLRSSQATMSDVLDDYHLVHEGPIKPFHDSVLRDVGLS